MPPPQYRPSKTVEGFLTLAQVDKERRKRVRLLAATTHQGSWGKRARELAGRIEADEETLANPIWFRDHQERCIGNLYWLIERQKRTDVTTFTIVKKRWAVYAGDLSKKILKKIEKQFRKNLGDTGIKPRQGWIYATIEAAYYPEQGCYQFHLHGAACGDYVRMIDALRKKRSYKPWKAEPGMPACRTPIRRSQKPLTNMPTPLSYGLKHFWKLRDAGCRVRLPGDEHTRMLLFLDQCCIEDLTILINLTVRNGRLEEA